ncbi:MAG TPA: N-acyl homoserine lactonase family protein [Acidobacteriaceae bacterium]|jgi:glyoxylase-like metal-dependent hydrolase (beta-lactamase superfamily II)
MRSFRILSLLFLTATLCAQKPQEPVYTVDAIHYATVPGFPVSGLISGADPARTIDIAMIYWLVRGNGHTILVDSGFYRPQFFKSMKIVDFQTPEVTLAKLNLKPADITDIVITHMHWDHADGMDQFPNARIWLQKEEYTYYTGAAWHSSKTHGGIEPDDVMALVKLNLAGRVSFVDGDDQTIFPGIRCYTGGKHTWASQFVTVPTVAGTVVLASDNMYLYENLAKHVPIAQTLDAASNLRAQDRMRTLATDPRLIIPGHDPEEFNRFPTVAPGVVEIRF